MESNTLLCPSSRCEEGAILLGVVLENGTVAFAADRIEIDNDFLTSAQQGRSPEKRFRFSSPCVKCACKQWAGDHCGVIDNVLKSTPTSATSQVSDLPRCSIRQQCRWFNQSGPGACRICPLVITDLLEDCAGAEK